jgi:hypothetical protein
MIILDCKNFNKEIFLKMKDEVLKADFISFDAEFSSVTTKRPFNMFDNSNSVYMKLRETVESALLLQLGISIFRTLPDGKTETAVYTVYTFPRRSEKRKKHSIENDCLAFLADNGFDFSRCFKDGLDFSRLEQGPNLLKTLTGLKKSHGHFIEESLKTELSSDDLEHIEDIPYTPETHGQHVFARKAYESNELGVADQEAIARYQKFMNNPEEKILKFDVNEKPVINYLTSPKSDFYNLIKEDHKVSLSVLKNHIKLTKVVKKAPKKIQKDDFLFKDIEHDKDKIISHFDFYGLSLLFYYIIKHNKPILFHNGLFDYLYIIDNFIADLPNDIRKFVALHQSLKLQIRDTKLLVTENQNLFPQFKKTRLSYILDSIREKEPIMERIIFAAESIVMSEDGNESQELSTHFVRIVDNEDKLHDAGYDSFITGMVYLHLEKHFTKKPENVLLEMHMVSRRLDLNVDLSDPQQCLHFDENITCFDRSLFIVIYDGFNHADSLATLMTESGSFKLEQIGDRCVFIFFSQLKEGHSIPQIVERINQRFETARAIPYEERKKLDIVL